MATPEEMALGVTAQPVYGTTQRATLSSPAMEAFEREFYTMNPAELKARYQNDPDFKAKVDAMNGETSFSAPAIESVAPAALPNSEERAAATVDPVVEPPVVTAEPVVEEAGDAEFYRQADGQWVAIVDLEDGSGAQKFYGKTQKEVAKALIKAQKNASLLIRHQESDKKAREKRAKDAEALLADPEILELPKRFTSRSLTPDEAWELAGKLKDKITFAGAMDQYFEARLGASFTEVADKLNASAEAAEIQRQALVGKMWVQKNDFYPSTANLTAIRTLITDKGWSITEKNLDKAYAFLEAQGHEFETDEPEEIEATTTVIPAVAAITVPPAPPAPPAATANKPTPTITIPAIPGTVVLGVRQGSASTALGPRSSSVRSDVPTALPVGLTAEEYRNTPMSVVKKRYATEPTYKAALDKLFAEGKA